MLRGLLTPLSWLYRAGWQAYLAMYRLGIKKAKEGHKPVVVIGNLTTGGSGKTPVTLYVARLAREMGMLAVIGCSGYGSPKSEAASLAPEGPLDPSEWGDEPAMIRWMLPDVPLVVGRRRVLAAELVHQSYPDAVLVMDDGFQHLPLMKHLSIVLEDPSPANASCLPAGPYREPRKNLTRADAVLWRSTLPSPFRGRGEGGEGPGPQAFVVRSSALRYADPDGRPVTPVRATALCAIGQPERFLRELQESLELVDPVVLGDHDPLTSGNLLERLPSDLPVVVTAKDWVKLRQRPDAASREFVIALQDVHIEPEAEFREWLERKLNAAM